MQRLAGKLVLRLPWLARGHIGRLCQLLTNLGMDDRGWSAGDVVTLIDQRNVALGMYSIAPGDQRDPLALFAHQLRAALADVTEPPRRRAARERAQLHAAQEQLRADEAQRLARHRALQVDSAAQARIAEAKAEIRQIVAEARRRAAHAPPYRPASPRN